MPPPLSLSSGNLLADRRFGFARDLESRGELAAAADVMTQALALEPGFASAWFTLGTWQLKLNQHGDAIASFRKAVAADPDDRHGASLHLARLGVGDMPVMPAAYLRTLFDQYATDFDRALVDDLGYDGPNVIVKAVAETCRLGGRTVRFATAVDLGCGTGLVAAAFGSSVDAWTGIDLSPGMIAQARKGGRYARLEIADMVAGLAMQDEASADLVVAADAFVYLGDLRPVLAGAARVLKSGGPIAFTIETHDGPGIVLGDKLRYAHAAEYVRAEIRADYDLVSLVAVSTRTDGGVAVPGLVVVALRRERARRR